MTDRPGIHVDHRAELLYTLSTWEASYSISLGTVGSKSCLYEFTELNLLSVGSQLPPRTFNTLID